VILANSSIGFKALHPMLTVVCKPAEPPYSSDDYLPSVMTCVNYLKMPDYSTVDILREKLAYSMTEGAGAFHLS
jgi:E3 ubiquitin-protein ligase TRIP12